MEGVRIYKAPRIGQQFLSRDITIFTANRVVCMSKPITSSNPAELAQKTQKEVISLVEALGVAVQAAQGKLRLVDAISKGDAPKSDEPAAPPQVK